MNKKPTPNGTLNAYLQSLKNQERSQNTVEKYAHDVAAFLSFAGDVPITHQLVITYKKQLEQQYAPTSVNSKLAAINGYLAFCGLPQCKVKPLKLQRRIFAPAEKELTQAEYKRLLAAAKGQSNERLYLVMQTICSTGIRVSELQYITIAAAERGRADINCKGKRRVVFLTPELCKMLLRYTKKRGIQSGTIFLSRTGKPLSRHRIWADMKALCKGAGVEKSKVFPHNLRHLFARTFYSIEKDLGRLADVLGHSNINTTRIYTMDCGQEHMRILRRLPLLQK